MEQLLPQQPVLRQRPARPNLGVPEHPLFQLRSGGVLADTKKNGAAIMRRVDRLSLEPPYRASVYLESTLKTLKTWSVTQNGGPIFKGSRRV